MQEFFDIFNDVMRIATLQPHWRTPHSPARRMGETWADHPATMRQSRFQIDVRSRGR